MALLEDLFAQQVDTQPWLPSNCVYGTLEGSCGHEVFPGSSSGETLTTGRVVPQKPKYYRQQGYSKSMAFFLAIFHDWPFMRVQDCFPYCLAEL
eukprot:3534408-Karenia_brevis.AAC.1